jgi:hypothetical protein
MYIYRVIQSCIIIIGEAVVGITGAKHVNKVFPDSPPFLNYDVSEISPDISIITFKKFS